MTPTIEGNKLIAEFMGAKFIEKDPMFMNGNSSFYYFKETGKSERILHYHFSWDWLMPVVQKIGSMRKDYPLKVSYYLLEYGIYNKIETIWKGCVDFITWYNQQNPKQ